MTSLSFYTEEFMLLTSIHLNKKKIHNLAWALPAVLEAELLFFMPPHLPS